MGKVQFARVSAREILDSRGNPTVEATVVLSDGSVGVAGVPSGASTGTFEAVELRDVAKKRYSGKGVLDAVYHVNKLISPALCGISAYDQNEIDATMLLLDGTDNKSKMGANAILAVSLASARAASNSLGIPLFKYIGGINANRLPIPMMNVLNGGAHASNNIDIQEFMIVPIGAESFGDALRMGSEIYHALGKMLKKKGLSVGVGDEGGYAPDLENDEQAIELLCEAINEAGYDTSSAAIALDAAASEWQSQKGYKLPKSEKNYTSEELISYWKALIDKYPIISIEDGLGESDFDGWAKLTKEIGDKVRLVGDDLFVTNTSRLRVGIDSGAGNSILIKPNQIGTLTETLNVIEMAKRAGYGTIISHRSGETEDTTIADIAVGINAGFIKSGAPCRSERVAKYNRLLKIEASLYEKGVFGL